MTETTRGDTGGGYRTVTISLFLCLFAGQSAVIAMSPVLADAAHDLHVSTAAAGQLRTVTGLAAGITAVALGAVVGRLGLGRQLLAASVLLAIASVASRRLRPSRCWPSPSCRSASPSPC
jgi:predicted MFS family arabinose efflux permease